MVRTYWFVPGFNEASGNLDLQPFARIDHVEACRPRAEMHLKVYAPRIYRARARVTAQRDARSQAPERPQMSNMTYDAIVLGAGPAGEVLAGRLADGGWTVAI